MDAERRRQGDRYEVTEEERARFHADGYVHLHGILSEQELAEIESVYARFLAGEIEVPGKDLCDMTGEYGSPVEEFRLINVMLPRRYFPPWQGNLYERRGQAKPVSAMTGLWVFPGIFIIVGPFVWFVKTNGALNDYWRSVGAQG